MLKMLTEPMELRGIQTHTSKKGTPYYILCCEDLDSYEQHKFLCRKYEYIPQGLKRGDQVVLSVVYNSYKDLNVVKVDKVAE